MLKRIMIIMMVLVFGLSGTSIAGVVELTDDAMDGINAGDWVVVKDADGNESTADVYTNNNTLWLLEESQKDIKAVSNANAIDSAVAVQTNIARVTGDASDNVAVNQSNAADLENFRPADSSGSVATTASLEAAENSSASQSQSGHVGVMNLSEGSNSASSYGAASGYSMNYNETLDAAAAIAGDSRSIGKYGVEGGAIAGAAVVDYDKVIVAGGSSSAAGAASASSAKTLATRCESSSSSASNSQAANMKANETETVTTSRNAKGANNHILLDQTSQQSINAVSNLNAVASGAAVQNNIASNVGVSGTITHVNSAAVRSGF